MKAKLLCVARRHPVVAYYVLVFAISWGSILLVLGVGGFMGTSATAPTQLYVGGPLSLLGPTVSGLVMTAVLHGKPGFRQLLSRLLRWRVGEAWYAVALLTAPVITTLSLLARSTIPAIVTASDKLGLLITGIGLGLVSSPFFEELGWTGFALPELRKRFNVPVAGLIMGVLWGLWHFPIFSASGRSSEPLSPVIFTLILLFTWLIPYRILMVWVYDRTQSLLLIVLMHVPIVSDQYILNPPASSSTFTAVGNIICACVLWVFVAVVAIAGRRGFDPRLTASLRLASKPAMNAPVDPPGVPAHLSESLDSAARELHPAK